MSQMQDWMKKSDNDELNDSDEMIYRQIQEGLLDEQLSWDEMMYYKLEHALKELAKKKGWIRKR